MSAEALGARLARALDQPQDCLLFCQAAETAQIIAVLEGGYDQVVALCPLVSGLVELTHVATLVAEADRLDLPLFADVRALDAGQAPRITADFPGAVCLADQTKTLRGVMGREATLVVDAGISRHQAIVGAEAGGSAVLFRQPAGQNRADLYPADDEGPQDVAALYAWWEQLMEPPAILDLASLDRGGQARPAWFNQVEFVAAQA